MNVLLHGCTLPYLEFNENFDFQLLFSFDTVLEIYK